MRNAFITQRAVTHNSVADAQRWLERSRDANADERAHPQSNKRFQRRCGCRTANPETAVDSNLALRILQQVQLIGKSFDPFSLFMRHNMLQQISLVAKNDALWHL